MRDEKQEQASRLQNLCRKAALGALAVGAAYVAPVLAPLNTAMANTPPALAPAAGVEADFRRDDDRRRGSPRSRYSRPSRPSRPSRRSRPSRPSRPSRYSRDRRGSRHSRHSRYSRPSRDLRGRR